MGILEATHATFGHEAMVSEGLNPPQRSTEGPDLLATPDAFEIGSFTPDRPPGNGTWSSHWYTKTRIECGGLQLADIQLPVMKSEF
jgi:hypothetical protein